MKIKSIILLLFVLQAIINVVNLAVAVSFNKDWHVCRGGDFKSDTIRKNRVLAIDKLAALLENSSYHGSLHTQVGDKPEEQVSASFLCTPTIREDECECALNKTFQYLLTSCPTQNEGVAWAFTFYATIMVRYSAGRKIFSVLDDWAWYRLPYSENVSAIALEKTMDSLAGKLKEKAAGGDALQKYAKGSVNYDGDEFALYMAVQCTPDLKKDDCVKCLSKASTEIRSCCTRKLLFNGRVISTNCYMWYSHVSFFVPPYGYDNEFCHTDES